MTSLTPLSKVPLLEEKELGHLVTQAKVFDCTHKRCNGEFVDKKSKTVSEKYASAILQKFGETSTQLKFDAKTWHEIVRGVGHGQLYGFGREDPRHILETSYPWQSFQTIPSSEDAPFL
ncbi:uncharacterized protein LOC110411355 [Herrania umbratica]|uniref:Uncharacterized protein LOC110411355 n=1 Tax=Herrania umbratica TaxID=108875 RepID=A0A6J0ZSA9_9ROSI|nr:uncharacterized protein LOC110411355 [Herrania umbratica]